VVVEGCAELVKRIGREVMRFACRDAGTSRSAGMRVSDPAAIRANFITGMLPIRTGLTSVGLAGSPIGMPEQAPTIAARPVQVPDYAGDSVPDQESDLRQIKGEIAIK